MRAVPVPGARAAGLNPDGRRRERIADRAWNTGEDVIHPVNGQTIKRQAAGGEGPKDGPPEEARPGYFILRMRTSTAFSSLSRFTSSAVSVSP